MWKPSHSQMHGSDPVQSQDGRRLLTCICKEASAAPELWAYARGVTDLLDGRLQTLCLERHSAAPETLADYDLLFLPGDSALSPADRATPFLRHDGASLLALRRPTWPLRRLLLLIRGEATDAATVEWGLRLAKASGSAVTLLAVLAPHPSGSARLARATGNFLAGHSLPGRQARRMLEQFADAEVAATLKLNQGTPERQVRQTILDGGHDLIVVGAEPPGRLLDRILEPLIPVLLQCTTQPILLARQRLLTQPTAAQQAETAERSNAAGRRSDKCNQRSV
ncbi:MAG: universal stress protein [Candidatus Promineifilaceae bacterium]|nr:universal stress protein [Candidatus Promineifilaceae bacterium]